MDNDAPRKDSLESGASWKDPFSQWEPRSRNESPLTPLAKRRTTWLLISSLLANVLFVLGVALLSFRESFINSQTNQFGIAMSFDEVDLRYQSLNLQYDDLWNGKFSTENRSGILDIPDSEHKEGVQRLGGIAMFHQLHCLWIIREDIRNSIDGKDIKENWSDAAHGNHCLDYLRKSILCHADPTIERPSISDEAAVATNGDIALDILGHETRMCRNSEFLYALRKSKMIKQDHQDIVS